MKMSEVLKIEDLSERFNQIADAGLVKALNSRKVEQVEGMDFVVKFFSVSVKETEVEEGITKIASDLLEAHQKYGFTGQLNKCSIVSLAPTGDGVSRVAVFCFPCIPYELEKAFDDEFLKTRKLTTLTKEGQMGKIQ